MDPNKNISLVGFMGTGKTSVGKSLGRKLSRRVVDIDDLIEKEQKKKISEIFAERGEAYFRVLEKEKIHEICKQKKLIITTGGGAVLDSENAQTLASNGWVIALSASPETIYQRVRHAFHRPLLKVADPLSEIIKLLAQRKPFYQKSDFLIETDGKTPAQIADKIVVILEKL